MLACLQTGINEVKVDWVGSSRPEFGQVKVKMLAAGICGAQLQELKGYKASGPFPHIMGHEGVGMVLATGDGVSRVKVDQKVVLHWRKGEGIESDFPRYVYNGKQITSGKVVTWAQEVMVSENRVTPVDSGLPDDFCTLLGCGLSTALGTIEQEANLRIGESILIIGCGGLGLNLLLASYLKGASRITVVDQVEKEIKGDARVSFVFKDWDEKVRDQYDVVVDTSGDPYAIECGIERMAPSGRMFLVGQPKDFLVRTGLRLFEGEGKMIKATQGGGFQPSVDIPRYARAWQAGLINLDGIISHRISLEEIERGIELVRLGNAGRILITL